MSDIIKNTLDDHWRPDARVVDDLVARLGADAPLALERAAGLWTWKRIWEATNPHSSRGGDRKSTAYRDKNQNDKMSFCSVAAECIGCDARTIQRDVELAQELGPAAMIALWGSKIADNAAALKVVANEKKPEVRERILKALKAHPDKSFDAILKALKLRAERDSDDYLFTRLYDLWGGANANVRRRFLRQIGASLNDKGRA